MGSIKEFFNKAASYESATLEFKSAKNGLPRSLWETYSSFANTQGGVVYLGVEEKNHKFIIDGLSYPQIKAYEKELWDAEYQLRELFRCRAAKRRAETEAIGLAEGKIEGAAQEKVSLAINLIRMNMGSLEKIAEATGLPLSKIEELANTDVKTA